MRRLYWLTTVTLIAAANLTVTALSTVSAAGAVTLQSNTAGKVSPGGIVRVGGALRGTVSVSRRFVISSRSGSCGWRLAKRVHSTCSI